jgi:hypothetical protein
VEQKPWRIHGRRGPRDAQLRQNQLDAPRVLRQNSAHPAGHEQALKSLVAKPQYHLPV